MKELLHFAGLFLETNVVFGGIMAAFLLGRNDRLRLPEWPLVLVGLALGPFLTSLVLYYAMALWHGIPLTVLNTLPMLVFATLALFAGDGWSRLWDMVVGIPRTLRDRTLWWFLAGSLLMLAITVLWLALRPLTDHDVLEYANQGRVFLRERAIEYQRHHYDAATGFHYVGLHGFSFPLLFTWEGVTGSLINAQGDLWTRSLTMWYGWLLVAFVWAVSRRLDRRVAVAAGIVLTATMGYFFMITVYHLDSYRIFFFTVSLAAFTALLRVPSRERLGLFALLCGAHAFIHSIGAILSGGLWMLLLVLLPGPWNIRLRWALNAAGVMLAAGAIHYVVDVFKGTGWILQDIIWF